MHCVASVLLKLAGRMAGWVSVECNEVASEMGLACANLRVDLTSGSLLTEHEAGGV